MKERTEHDLIGEKRIPANAYWGIHTQRAADNFSLSGITVSRKLIKAMAAVKKACAQANAELDYLSPEKAKAVISACDEICSGKLADSFFLDALQGGAGTSTNMNVNEVIANRALEILGREKGDYDYLHPIDDVNRHQSTNDVYPTALKIAAIGGLRLLSENIARLQGVFQKKEKEFAKIMKIGRTELQEAVPITLGAEFSAFAEALSRDRWRTFKCEERLRVVNIGATAVGTGITAPRDYIFLVIEKLRALSGLGISRAENTVEATANNDMFVEVSAILKAHAAVLIKTANDLRLLHALGEIKLPARQAGSSIMPGKVNPVICEAMIQTGIKVMANDLIVGEAVSRSTLQICEFMPLIAQALLESLEILNNANVIFAEYAEGIQASPETCRKYFNESLSIITAFVPLIGYEKAGALINEFSASGEKDFFVYLKEKLGEETVVKTLTPEKILALGYKK